MSGTWRWSSKSSAGVPQAVFPYRALCIVVMVAGCYHHHIVFLPLNYNHMPIISKSFSSALTALLCFRRNRMSGECLQLTGLWAPLRRRVWNWSFICLYSPVPHTVWSLHAACISWYRSLPSPQSSNLDILPSFLSHVVYIEQVTKSRLICLLNISWTYPPLFLC